MKIEKFLINTAKIEVNISPKKVVTIFTHTHTHTDYPIKKRTTNI